MKTKNKLSKLKIIAIFILIYISANVGILVLFATTALARGYDRPNRVADDIQPPNIKIARVMPKTTYIEADVYVAGFDSELLKTVSEEQVESIIEPTPIPDKVSKFSKQDLALLERVTMSEASTQSFDAQVAVAQTILNRLYSGEFGASINEIVHTPYQYSTADNGDPNEQVHNAVIEAINNPPHPDNMFYFREDYYHTWAVDYKPIGVFYFSTDPKL